MKAAEGQRQLKWSQLGTIVGWIADSLTDKRRWPASKVWLALGVELQGILVFAIAFGFHAYLAPYGVDPHHDGIMFKPALDVSQGHMVFRDTFTQYGGVTVLLQAAALKLFGARLLVIKLQTALMYALAFFILWKVWCRLVPSVLATVACVIGTLTAPDSIASALPWSSVYAAVFQALALLWAVRYFERGRERELVYSGCAAALAFWCRQPVGAFLAGGMLIALVLIAQHVTPNYSRPPRPYSVRVIFGETRLGRACGVTYLFGGGLFLVNAVILLWLARYGAIVDWWKQSIVFAQVWSKATGAGHSLTQIIACLFPGAHLLVWCLLATVVAVQALRSTSTFLDPKAVVESPRAATVLLASTVAVTSWFQFYPVACDYHCYWAAIPMFGVFAYVVYSSHRSGSLVFKSLIGLFAMVVVFKNDVERRLDAIDSHISSQNVPIKSIPALRGMRVNAADATNYDALQSLLDAYLRVHPEGTLVTTSGNGLFPALTTNQALFHPMYLWWDMMSPVYPGVDAIRLKYIKEKLPMVHGSMEVPDTHVYVGHISWGGVGYNILVPKDTHPTEILECSVAGVCTRRPIT